MANADIFRRMGGSASAGLPTRVAGQPEAVLADLEARSSGSPGQQMEGSEIPLAPTRAGMPTPKSAFPNEMLGSGGYIYEITPLGYKIVKGRGGEGTVVGKDSPFYDLIQKDIALVQQDPTLHKVDLLAGKKPVAPKAKVSTGEMEAMEVPAAPAPTPEMTQSEYEDALIAAPQGSKVPPPPSRPDAASEFGTRAYLREKVGGAMEKLGEMASRIPTERKDIYPEQKMESPMKLFEGYIASEQLRSAGHDAVQGLVKNGMDFVAARKFVTRAIETEGEKALPMLRSLGDRPLPPSRSQSKSQSAKK